MDDVPEQGEEGEIGEERCNVLSSLKEDVKSKFFFSMAVNTATRVFFMDRSSVCVVYKLTTLISERGTILTR